jgi:hypothetical protein
VLANGETDSLDERGVDARKASSRSLPRTPIPKEESAMKKFFGALIAASFVFAAVFASASTLTVAGATIQNGTISATCQTDPVVVSYLTQVNGSGVNEVTSVKLSGIDGACYGKSADIALIYNTTLGSGVTAFNLWGTLDAAPSTSFSTNTGANHSSLPAPLSSQVNWVNVQIGDKS